MKGVEAPKQLIVSEIEKRGKKLARQEKERLPVPSHPMAKRLLRCFLYLTVLASHSACAPKKPDMYSAQSLHLARPEAVAVEKKVDKEARNYVQLAQKQPELALKLLPEYQKKPFAKEVLMTLYQAAPEITASQLNHFKDEPYAQDIFQQWMKGDNPAPFFMALEGVSPEIATRIIENAILKDPIPVLKSIQTQNSSTVYYLLSHSTRPEIKNTITFIDEHGADWTTSIRSAQLQSIIREHAPFSIQKDVYPSDPTLSGDIKDYKKHESNGYAKAHHDLLDYAVMHTDRLNDSHELPPAERFEEIRQMNADQLFIIMILGDDSLYTSSFNGVFESFLNQLKQEQMPIQTYLSHFSTHDVRTFMKLCATYGHLPDILSRMDGDVAKDTIHQLISGLDTKSRSSSDYTSVGELLYSLSDPEHIRRSLDEIKKEYTRAAVAHDIEALKTYGYLASAFGHNQHVSDEFINELMARYPLPSYDSVSPDKLYDATGKHVQRYFFPGDEDGHASFEHFISNYKDHSKWDIQNHSTYVVISSLNTQKQLILYANKPDSEQQGQKDISTIFTQHNIRAHIEIPRGHSYNVEHTIDQLSPDSPIVFLGSCGGFKYISQVLARTPDAHILSTRGTGAMAVNDEILKEMNTLLANGGAFSWDTIAERSQKQIGSDDRYSDYVFPNHNISLALTRALQTEK